MNSFTQDLRYGLRSLLKTPRFTLVAVLTLALGVGANAAIFSVLEAVVLRDLPYQDPDRLAVLWTRNIQQNLPDGSSFLNFRDWKAPSREFENMAAYVRPEFTRGTPYNDQARRSAFFTDAMQRLRALPGVAAVGAVSDFFIHRQPDYRIALEGNRRAGPRIRRRRSPRIRSSRATSKPCAFRSCAVGCCRTAISPRVRHRSW
jgi:hypothetical protein